MTDRTPAMLVCVYYRVAECDSQRVISAVREFQRTLQSSEGVNEAEVLLRFDLPAPASSAPPTDDCTSIPLQAPPSGIDARVDPGANATVMETYRLTLPAATGPGAHATARAFLATLETAALPLAGLLRGTRHVELFAPCVL